MGKFEEIKKEALRIYTEVLKDTTLNPSFKASGCEFIKLIRSIETPMNVKTYVLPTGEPMMVVFDQFIVLTVDSEGIYCRAATLADIIAGDYYDTFMEELYE